MGKKQHSKDRMYITATEWKHEWGGHKEKKAEKYAALEFDRCAISFQPFQTPVSTKEGHVFDLLNIVPFIKKYKVNPCTGTKCSTKDLIRLKFKKNTDGKYCCPITYKVFSQHTHIVFIKQSGNVYCMDAIEELNYKAKHFEDLISGESFIKSDVITIQDPKDPSRRDVKAFYHVAGELTGDEVKTKSMTLSDASRRVLDQIDPQAAARAERSTKDATAAAIARVAVNKKKEDDGVLRSQFTDNRYASSFTSTAITPFTSSEKRILSEQEILEMRYKQYLKGKKGEVGEKGFARLVTTAGNINLQLDVDMAPKTCHNFFLLAQKGYYKDVIFHRLIKDFMIQGGDPTGTGRGGESAWGGKFRDEFHPHMSHDARGLLSMANAGPNTNGSQFFITFAPCAHLDRKHTIFGRVVGGFDTLARLERWETGAKGPGANARFEKDRPTPEIKILDVIIYKNPYDDPFVPDEEKKKKEQEEPTYTEEEEKIGQWYSAPQPMNIAAKGSGISRFLDAKQEEEEANMTEKEKKKRRKEAKKAMKKRKREDQEVDDLDSIQFNTTSSNASQLSGSLQAKAIALANIAAAKKKAGGGGFDNW